MGRAGRAAPAGEGVVGRAAQQQNPREPLALARQRARPRVRDRVFAKIQLLQRGQRPRLRGGLREGRQPGVRDLVVLKIAIPKMENRAWAREKNENPK